MIEQVDRALHDQGITGRTLAIRAGITEKHLSQIRQGHATGSLDVWQRLATGLGRTWRVTLE